MGNCDSYKWKEALNTLNLLTSEKDKVQQMFYSKVLKAIISD